MVKRDIKDRCLNIKKATSKIVFNVTAMMPSCAVGFIMIMKAHAEQAVLYEALEV